jgi:predicted component of type VI protein secretion system
VGVQSYLEIWTPTGRRVCLLDGARLTIGRHASNDVVLDADEEVSRVHAVLEKVGPAWVLRDLSSRNGTAVNGDRISGDRPLASGDELRVGNTRLTFRSESPDQLVPTRGALPAPALTPRERDVLIELFRPAASPGVFTEPASTREIAAALVISEAAVKQHLTNLYDKFGIHAGLDSRRLRLANEALRRGAVSVADVRATGR